MRYLVLVLGLLGAWSADASPFDISTVVVEEIRNVEDGADLVLLELARAEERGLQGLEGERLHLRRWSSDRPSVGGAVARTGDTRPAGTVEIGFVLRDGEQAVARTASGSVRAGDFCWLTSRLGPVESSGPLVRPPTERALAREALDRSIAGLEDDVGRARLVAESFPREDGEIGEELGGTFGRLLDRMERRLDVLRLARPLVRREPVAGAILGPPVPESRPFLGLTLGASDGESGLPVLGSVPEGPAWEAGIRARDHLVALGGRFVHVPEEALVVLAECRPGDRLRAIIHRDGEHRGIEIRVGVGTTDEEDRDD